MSATSTPWTETVPAVTRATGRRPPRPSSMAPRASPRAPRATCWAPTPTTTAPTPTTLTLAVPSQPGVGGSVTVTATLLAGGAPVAGALVTFTITATTFEVQPVITNS